MADSESDTSEPHQPHDPHDRDFFIRPTRGGGSIMADSESDASKPRSPLTSLPAELRTKIYRLVLIESTGIAFRKAVEQPTEPGLLCVNRQVREETIKIWYAENQFTVYVNNYDIDFWQTWYCKSKQRQESLCGNAQLVFCHVGSRPDWANLLRWLEHCYHDRCPAPRKETQTDGARGASLRSPSFLPKSRVPVYVASLILPTVYKLRDEGRTWTQVEGRMELVHNMLQVEDPIWASSVDDPTQEGWWDGE